MKGKSISAFIWLLVAALFICGYIGYRFFAKYVAPFASSVPSELANPGVVKGGDWLEKGEFYTASGIGSISQIQEDVAHGSGRRAPLLLVGEEGAIWLDDQKQQLRHLQLDRKGSGAITAVDLHDGNGTQFLSEGHWSSPVVLFDQTGKTRWTYGEGLPGVNSSAAGDLDGDGRSEVAVGFNGEGGIHLLNASGSPRWQQSDGNVWRVRILSNGRLVHSNAAGILTVRDSEGKILGTSKPVTYLAKFTVMGGSLHNAEELLVAVDSNSIVGFSPRGEVFLRVDAPSATPLGEPRAVHVEFDTKGLAVLVSVPHWRRSVLYIYDDQNRRVYQEVFNGACGALHPHFIAKKFESLLIGCETQVFEYRKRKPRNEVTLR